MGFEFIYVYDGALFPDKTDTIIQRRNESYEKHQSILQAIDSGLNINNLVLLKKLHIGNITPYFPNFSEIAKKYGRVVRANREGDQEIVFLANKHKAFAVISDDTDFLIFGGNWRFWSAQTMDLDKKTIKEYDKVALRSHLGLSYSRLILFATLAGNDFLTYDNVKVRGDYLIYQIK